MKVIKRAAFGDNRDSLFPGYVKLTFTGTSGDDIFTGGIDNDTARGNGGNDQLSGGGGHDTIGGGEGADIVNGDDGSDTLYSFDISPPFNRPYYGNPWTPPVMDWGTEVDIVNGGTGGDVLFAGYGDNVDGGTDSDTLYISFMGAAAGVTVDFRQLNNNGSIVIGGGTLTNIETIGWVEGSNFDDTIRDMDSSSNFAPMFGMGGNDHLYGGYYTGDMHGGDGDDVIDRGSSPYGFQHYGEAGNDLLIGSYNGETLDGGTGNDELRGNGGFDDLFGGDGDDLMDAGSYGDSMNGGAGNDIMYGAGDADDMDGGAGDDTMYGDFSLIHMGNSLSPSSNNERMFGGTGADIVRGDQGNDTIWSGESVGGFATEGIEDAGLERDQLFGGDGNDALAIGYGDDADGGIGSDTLRISLAGAAAGVTFSTAGFTPGGSWSVNGGTIQNVETLTVITGTAFADTITIATHTFGINVNTGDGDDIVTSNGSSAAVNGGNGSDRLISGIAGDSFDGAAGTDVIDYRNAASGVTVVLGLAAGQTGSGAGGDSLLNVENIDGSGFDDSLNGSNDANIILGMAGIDALDGKGGNDSLDGGLGADAMTGGLGNDTFFVDDAGDQLFEAAGQGSDIAYASVTWTLAAGQHVETLVVADPAAALGLTGNELANTLIGNGADNALNGGAGNDVLLGGAGADVMTGGADNDIYYVDDAGDSVVEGAGGGARDVIYTSLSFALAAGVEVEVLAAAAPASGTPLQLSGNGFANELYGNAGDNLLDGGGGADYMAGYGGNDLYFVDHGGDAVAEGTNGGRDVVYASVSYALTAGQEIEVLSTAAQAGTGAIDLTGNALRQEIYGNDGANIIAGGGGADYLQGYGGNDVYIIDHGSDYVVEAAAGGRDVVYARVNYILTAGAEVEVISTISQAATTAINLSGNELFNELYGNAGVNQLDGGAGADYMAGFGGNDLYFVDHGSDYIAESAGGGRDVVYAKVSYTLAAGADIEVLSVASQGSGAAIDLTGNELVNELYGNAEANYLDGGAGADYLQGYGGNDSYVVETQGDVVVEGAGEGTRDVVFARASYTLGAGQQIEVLSAISSGATTAIDLIGNALANELYGNAGANVLNGGLGADYLLGFAGADSFAFTTALGAGNVDQIGDFVSGTDKILLDDAVFTGLTAGALPAGAFVTGAAAADADDRIVYNSATGQLFFDADGSGAGAAVLFATLQGNPALAASDFQVI